MYLAIRWNGWGDVRLYHLSIDIFSLFLRILILLKNLLLPQNVTSFDESTLLNEVECASLSSVSLVKLTINLSIKELSFG